MPRGKTSKKRRTSKKKGELPFAAIQTPFHNLIEATSNELEREWPRHYQHIDSARVTFYQILRNCINNYNTIFWVCADVPKDPHRKRIYALSLPPLTRTLFEQLIMYVFLLEDVPNFVPYVLSTGYTELRFELKHCLTYHGTDRAWKPYIRSLKKRVKDFEVRYKLTKRQIDNPLKTIGRGPTPGGLLALLKSNRPKSKAIPFIEYINSWLYRKLSGQAHLNILELVNKSVFFSKDEAKQLIGKDWEKETEELLEDYRQDQVFTAITIMLAMVSELQVHFHFGQIEKAKYVWAILNEYSDMTKDFWKTRYEKLLA